jgi:hypothetical protein
VGAGVPGAAVGDGVTVVSGRLAQGLADPEHAGGVAVVVAPALAV